ncbi:ecto-ADP-ribosyltransferase 5-like isoform X1 [Danio aesculapii]|uniref:ecto-ADP-ribosyltransferase 5-like isoform X1 n=1 Tax=Danio aesculapii TaxID=1142201 RepID=UPI0024C0888C|nr:ecto-ADP-ribosyltransferase 5-like isoform X1 [Danio aesculapii]
MMIEALLLIVAALQDHGVAVKGQIVPLDMAPNSADDQYEGCTERMADLVRAVYLPRELSNFEFNRSWQEGQKNAIEPEDNLSYSNSIAIYVYTNSDYNVFKHFNDDTRSGKQDFENDAYRWYSLHFLLTEAIQILKETQPGCVVTYRGSMVHFDTNVVNKKVRFGSFTSSSFDIDTALAFGNVSCFEIHTCEGANLTKYSKFPEEEEVLIPPYETFTVSGVYPNTNECQSYFVLEKAGKQSNLNCAVVTRRAKCIKNRSFSNFQNTFDLNAFCRCSLQKLKLSSHSVYHILESEDQPDSVRCLGNRCSHRNPYQAWTLQNKQWKRAVIMCGCQHFTAIRDNPHGWHQRYRPFRAGSESDYRFKNRRCYLSLRSLRIDPEDERFLQPCCSS